MELLNIFLRKELNINDINVIDRFNRFNKYLLDWNSKMNLISRNSESIEVHVLNSIFFLPKYPVPLNSYIADIGTGGGFPGIPLKILRSDLKIVLIDSIAKKTNAVKDIASNLGLKDIEVICGRAETISRESAYRKKFDIVTAKSVAPLDKLYEWAKSFLKEKGEMIFIKGGDIADEINNLRKKSKNTSPEIIEYNFDPVYGIEDKKIVIIKKL
jgi:16S rRNA (guanine527-N7)-methyltransferase